ncbi:MAG: pyridoxamine 5'-phosphate oxidase family protein [Chloroflexota bacterium]
MTLPSEVLAVFDHFRTCEFSTIAKDGTPTTWPMPAHYLPEQKQFLLTTSIGLPQKAFNIRREPRVSLLFSDPTASGLVNPPAVLVQGTATTPDNVVTALDACNGLRSYWRDTIFARQPASEIFSNNPLAQKLMDWYYMRLIIHVTPRRILWWPNGDFTQPAQAIDLSGFENLTGLGAAHVE